MRIAVFLLAFPLLTAMTAKADTVRGITISDGQIYITPGTDSTKLAQIDRGREVAVLDHSGEWVQVLATLDKNHDITGWTLASHVILPGTPDGDQILFGEAVDSEAQASRRGGRKGAAQDAMRLYARMAEYFPNSPLAGEALYRAADIQWQLEKEDASRLPSARERDPLFHQEMDEEMMKSVEKKFPHTKWADLAAYEMIDNKLCGDWEGDPKCPERESGIYEDYVKEHPESPKEAEALYEAAWRQGVLVDLYKGREEAKKSESARTRAISLAQRIVNQYSQTDWAARARRLVYMLEQKIPTYGTAVE